VVSRVCQGVSFTIAPAADRHRAARRGVDLVSVSPASSWPALFSLDAFAGGLVVQSLLAIWLFEHFGLSLATAGAIFFCTGVLSALSYFAAAWIAERVGLINTMVFTHLPANLCLGLVPFAPSLSVAITLLLVRSALSQMDVPTRTSYVMAVVAPEERAAAASVTSVPRSLAAAVSPTLAGAMLAASGFGWPLVLAGGLKAVYDLLLLMMFRQCPPAGGDGQTLPSIAFGLQATKIWTRGRGSGAVMI
jgi:predicted MFS family arabinose efflux permease